MGVGEVFYENTRISAAEGLRIVESDPVVFEAKEGLAMINGTQAISALGSLALDRASMLLDLADLAAAMTLDALLGTDAAYDERIHKARPHAGQLHVAQRMRELVSGSEIRESHRECGKVQDAYSLTGEADYLIKLVVPDLKHLSKILNDVFLPHDGVARLRSSIVLDRVKQTPRLPLGHLK